MRRISQLFWLLGNRNFLFISAIVLGITVGWLSRWTQPLTLPALALAMTVSTTQVASSTLRPSPKLVRPLLLSVALSYILQGAAILIPARLLVAERDLWIGFVMTAAAPPGAAIIPFSYVLGGDTAFALVGSVGAYLAALAIVPAMTRLLVGQSIGEPARFITILFQLIVLPLVLSRLLLAGPVRPSVERWRGKIINWAFFLVIFTIIGLNQQVFLRQPQVVILISAITMIRSFGLGFVLEKVLRRMQVDRPTRMTWVLMSTLKNGGFAAGTALALFGERASVPAGVGAAIAVPYLLWLTMRWGTE